MCHNLGKMRLDAVQKYLQINFYQYWKLISKYFEVKCIVACDGQSVVLFTTKENFMQNMSRWSGNNHKNAPECANL